MLRSLVSGAPVLAGAALLSALLAGCYVAVGVDSVAVGGIGITDHPDDVTVRAGERASFAVSVVGSTPMTFQWLRDDVAIAGATGPGYRTPPTVLGDGGALFAVRVCNDGFCVRSDAAVLTVLP